MPARGLAGAALTGRASSAPSTPTSASNASAPARCACATAGWTPASDDEDVGLAVRVVHDGAWGFAGGIARTADAAAALAEQAVATAQVSRVLSAAPVELAARAGLRRRQLGLGLRRRPVRRRPRPSGSAGCAELSERLLAADGVDHVDAAADAGAWRTSSTPTPPARSTTQQRVRIAPGVHRGARRPRRRARSRRCARSRRRPAAAGSTSTGTGWDFDAEIAELPELLRRARQGARASRPARYDLVIDPSNLWLTIHESIGHATELDRALGYEAAYAGTSFATLDKLGSLQLRQPGHERHRRPHRRARPGHDRLRRRGRRRPSSSTSSATACWSATSSTGRWPAQRRRLDGAAPTAARSPTRPAHIPLQRMANVSLQPAAGRPVASRS